MGRFISYFDYLGYKEFITKNETDEIKRRVGHLLVDIEASLGLGKFNFPPGGWAHADLSQSKINCLNISDTVIYWTHDDSLESLGELLKVSFEFNYRSIVHNMPTRGTMMYDEVDLLASQSKNDNGATYSVNMIYGKGLVNAHLKTDNQNWAGFVVDESVVRKLEGVAGDTTMLNPYSVRYNVPYKKDPPQFAEFAFRLHSGADKLNAKAYENWLGNVKAGFARDNKNPESPRAKELLANTVKYLETFRE